AQGRHAGEGSQRGSRLAALAGPRGRHGDHDGRGKRLQGRRGVPAIAAKVTARRPRGGRARAGRVKKMTTAATKEARKGAAALPGRRETAPRGASARLWLAEGEAILREAKGLRLRCDVPLRTG